MLSADAVAASTTPVAGNRWSRWNWRTAAWVPSPKLLSSRSTSGNRTNARSVAGDNTGSCAALRAKRERLNRFSAEQFAAEYIASRQTRCGRQARREFGGSIRG